MPLPVTFATLAAGNQNASLLDTQFAAIGAMVEVPCTATGQNSVVLAPNANTPTITAYTDLTPKFVWKQAQTSSGAVTIALTGLPALTAYRNNGQTAIGSGDLVAGFAYTAFQLASLNSGMGGFIVDAFLVAASAGAMVTTTVYSGSQTITIPASASKGYVQMWGATGGSGGVNNANSGSTGAGGYLEKLLTGLTAGNTLTYTQGAAGAAGSAVPGNGGNGTVTTLASGTQTISTLTCNASNGSLAANAAASLATAGATATGGDINIYGQDGLGLTTAAVPSGFSFLQGGRNFFSIGAQGVFNAGAFAGNAGSVGGLKITWLT